MMTLQQRRGRRAAAALLCLLLILITGKQCRAGWQPEPGVPTTEQLRAIDGYAADRILAVGNAGTILQYGGTAWSDVSGITEKTLFGVWWAAKDKAFAVGDTGTILQYDGADWTTMDSGTTLRLRDIWGASAECMFAVGETGTILRFDGNSWKKMDSPTTLTLQSVWGSSCSSVYAVGGASGTGGTGSGTIMYYDGSSWTSQSASVTPRLMDVFGFAEGSVYAAGEDGALLETDGNGVWQSMASATAETLRCIWGTSGANLYAVGDYGTALHYDGATWTPEYAGTTQDLFSIWGLSQERIYAVGRSGVVLRYEDNSTDNSTLTCPFKEAVADADDLRLLRAARDQKLGTPAGLLLAALFYATAPETARIAAREPAVRKKISILVARNRSLLQALASGQAATVESSTIHETAVLLRAVQARSSCGPGIMLSGIIRALEQEWLPALLDITIEP